MCRAGAVVKASGIESFRDQFFVVGSRPATDIFFIFCFRSLALYRLQNVSQLLGVCFLQLEKEIETAYFVRFALILSYYLYNRV